MPTTQHIERHPSPVNEKRTPEYPISCSEGCVEFAKIRQPISRLRQEASLCTIEAEVSITRDQVVVFQPWNHIGQELDLSRSITCCPEIVDPDWLAFGRGGRFVDGVLEILLTTRIRSPEPVNTHEAYGAAGGFAQVEEFLEPREVAWVLKIAWSPE